MQIAAMLIGMAFLALGVLGLSLFVPIAGGGSAFDQAWPYLTGAIAALISAAAALAVHARRHPDAWLHQSVWPRVVVALIVGLIAMFVAGGMLV